MGRTKKAFRHLIPILIILIALPIMTQSDFQRNEFPIEIRCKLNLRNHHPKNLNFSTGFNYEILHRFSEQTTTKVDIQLGKDIEEDLNLLKIDSIDLLIIPYSDTINHNRDFSTSNMMEDSTLWVMRRDDRQTIHAINHWMKLYTREAEYSKIKNRFAPSYEPYRRILLGWQYASISPYDELIMKYAPEIGWDWRMLTALVWQESRFRIDAVSHKGAEGLLQMLPSTARQFKNDDMLDPEKSLKAGTAYIKRLNRIFSRFATAEDLPKYVMAAYSAGEGRVLDCIRYARAHELPYSTWDNMIGIIDTLRNDPNAPTDTLLQYGGLRGDETIKYVSNVYSLYEAFSFISPAQSSKDLPEKQTETVSSEAALSQDRKEDLPQ